MALLSELRNYTNRPGKTFDANKTDDLFAEDMNAIREAIQEGSKGIKTERAEITLGADAEGLKLVAHSTQTSKLLNLVANDGTTHRFSIEGDGQVLFAEGTKALPSISFASFPSVGFRHRAGFGIDMVANGSTLFVLDQNVFVLKSTIDLGWSSNEPDTQVIDTGIERLSAGVVKVTDGSTGWGDITYEKSYANVQSATVADSGDANPGTLTLEPTSDYIEITNNDADGADITMSETNAVRGHRVTIVVVANAGGTVNFADTTGVTELAGAANLGLWDSIELMYIGDRWVELSRSNN